MSLVGESYAELIRLAIAHLLTFNYRGTGCRATHICVGKLTLIRSDNGLSPERRQAIIWTNAGILLIGPLVTNFSEIVNCNSSTFIQENAF